ncbi:Endoribonuclease L-PSP/chorismate mutase-like protein [Microdochium bolleyi]|uniref:Endoribonuclease L-PSP/chorismate mutase-like protein n=1 Tax=Microdochium bolleyi TaxID=196109 RepID=A0A136IT02_9PEZI|nr:Endoribonuclease L-PSP/chorismate mutase-like protein [Microdochium bolleyi]
MSAHHFPGTGALAQVSAILGLSQAVSIPTNGRIIITSGQCGFREDMTISDSMTEQIKQLARNAHKLLQEAGATGGLKDVFQVTVYMTEMTDELIESWKVMKNQYGLKAVETGVSVPQLYEGAKVEMTFYALGSQAGTEKL